MARKEHVRQCIVIPPHIRSHPAKTCTLMTFYAGVVAQNLVFPSAFICPVIFLNLCNLLASRLLN